MAAQDKDAAAQEPVGFLARWGKRKAEARAPVAAAPLTLPLTPPQAKEAAAAEVAAEPAPSYADVELLTQASDYTRFMSQDVDAGVQRAAMKKLFFSDPHFNLMDGLDTYIDDYSQPDPLPLSMLRQLHQSQALGLFELEEEAPVAAAQDLTPPKLVAPETPSPIHDDDHADLRLQQDDAAGRPGPEDGSESGARA
ncbi:DUF3306 domain-containing protein [Paucibacter sp. B2R-40]|uniref:DUF3306 domain-containing protein n=1 Tax=Paucibacter sp. B2R-40 TaxID=2893554 RepID=UPI0021E35B52|nr:DUF3306 domain-containing protein [Paucibacter sp. B2R-40]MCV2354253.1 DUF3306 domain-containing protein [Paucibacter sp. B2R-40]